MRKPTRREVAIGGAALAAAAGLALGARALMKRRRAKAAGSAKPVMKPRVAKAKKAATKVVRKAKSAAR